MKIAPHKSALKKYCYLAFFLFFSAIAFAEPEVMVVKYSGNVVKDLRPGHNYIVDLIKLVLEQTKSEFGDYQLQVISQELNIKRKAALISEGDVINLSDSPPKTPIADANVIPIPIDIFKGLLGHRVCIINGKEKRDLENINNINTLRKLKIGQALGWPDLEVYSVNNIETITSPTFDGLFGMLAFNRFDCLALGVNEVDSVFADKRATYSTLAVDKKLLIVYEYPFYLYVSKKYPKIADRLNKGMEKVKRSKQFAVLFDSYFHANIVNMNLKNRNLVCLESPFSAKKNQCSEANISAGLDELVGDLR